MWYFDFMDEIPTYLPYEIKKVLRKRQLEKTVNRQQKITLVIFLFLFFLWSIFGNFFY